MSSHIRTFTGVLIDPLKPDPLLIDIIDIAHSLSGEGRYTNHTPTLYSVGMHSLAVMRFAAPEYKFDALMHDSSEAYLRDMSKPVKYNKALAGYRRIEHRLMCVIAKRYGFTYPKPPDVERWDTIVRKVEQAIFMRGHDYPEPSHLGLSANELANVFRVVRDRHSMSRDEIKAHFLEHFYYLRALRRFPAS